MFRFNRNEIHTTLSNKKQSNEAIKSTINRKKNLF